MDDINKKIAKFEEYIQKRNTAVLNGDLKEFQQFVKDYAPEQYDAFMKQNEVMQQATNEKMACHITIMPKERVDRAVDWLRAHGLSTNILR